MALLKSVNPYNPSRIINYQELTDMKLMVFVGRAETAFKKFRGTSFAYRKERLKKVSAILKERQREFAEIITSEMGKPITQSLAEVNKCAWVCEYYADNGAKFLKKKLIPSDASESYVIYEPLGPVLAVMPWNFPFWQLFRFAAPALMAGNTILLKHASNVQGCGIIIEEIFSEAGFEEGVVQNLAIGAAKVKQVIEHEYVRAVTLTGSEQAGSAVASVAGSVIKKCVLELGGNNAFVVLNDAHIEYAVNIAMTARLQNGGQSCIAAKRFILEQGIADDFISLLRKKLKALKTGDPMDEATELATLSSNSQAAEVSSQVDRSVKMGAEILAGGKRDGAFYEPTILSGVKPGMPVFDEEVFGPVFAITVAVSPIHALELSNLSEFGLGMQVFTQSESDAQLFIDGAREGAVFINGMVKSDPRLPFGGVKKSGYGRELSVEGIREFVNVKTIWKGS